MDKKKWVIPFLFLVSLLAGCSSSEEEFIFPEAAFTMSSDIVKVNEPLTLEVKVTAAEKEVNDADVSFEYWLEEKADEEHTKIPAENAGKGTYTGEISLSEPGVYSVYFHADALDMHLMDKYQFTVTE
ncbi:YtkA [Schinkia azotoformans MEV2011]|uniref:YtkA n=1 Tax=Schinkia azotoformans MEV2011 TaxID=1348973 RepID=A0A072NMV2_SCHAZ|nr:FixH family protein [Schinkia azotoformans]KEF38238.1 YtkA [Schinkia azotoformans MEV2011]MEC1698040.1 FixH family protein [Schinkia azotoformans]MEC1715113.1 FixH family protein [Schinkia azotoformans]MEC1726962.1 FixH family protein [Schinkia azotoformans]MEC1742630.1 FixH family protein [Schinkia azotoformans]